MPALRKIIPQNILPLGTIVPPADYASVRNAWIDRQGNLIYAGYWQHTETAQLLGYDTTDLAEKAGLVHISESSFNGLPQFLSIPRRVTDQQYDTIAFYCESHKIRNPLLK